MNTGPAERAQAASSERESPRSGESPAPQASEDAHELPPEPIAFEGLDKLLEHRVRLAVCVLLSRYAKLNFTRLKALLSETDGSLGTHLSKLEAAGHLRVERQFTGRRPSSWYALTEVGRDALKRHVLGLESLFDRIEEESP